jgi:hypothetical protein
VALRLSPAATGEGRSVVEQLSRNLEAQTSLASAAELLPAYVTRYEMARQLGRLDVAEPEALQAGIITQEELRRWRSSLERADADGMFFASASMVLVAGRKPSG